MDKQDLIARITAIRPGVFELEELRCPVCDGKLAGKQRLFGIIGIAGCPICDGGGYRDVITDDVLDILDELAGTAIVGPTDRRAITDPDMAYFARVGDGVNNTIVKYGSTRLIAALRVLLAIIEKAKK